MTVMATSIDLRFDADAHRYFLGEREVPGVTRVITEVHPEIYRHSSEYAMERGSAVHRAIHYYLDGDLDESTISGEVRGYFNAALAFLADPDLEVIEHEKRVVNAAVGYAGTLDLVARYNSSVCVIDWKSGNPGWQAGLQIAAYLEALRSMSGGEHVRTRRIAIWLHDDGTYTQREYKDRNDYPEFLAALAVWNRKRMEGWL